MHSIQRSRSCGEEGKKRGDVLFGGFPVQIRDNLRGFMLSACLSWRFGRGGDFYKILTFCLICIRKTPHFGQNVLFEALAKALS